MTEWKPPLNSATPSPPQPYSGRAFRVVAWGMLMVVMWAESSCQPLRNSGTWYEGLGDALVYFVIAIGAAFIALTCGILGAIMPRKAGDKRLVHLAPVAVIAIYLIVSCILYVTKQPGP
jgi:hypothetical protein